MFSRPPPGWRPPRVSAPQVSTPQVSTPPHPHRLLHLRLLPTPGHGAAGPCRLGSIPCGHRDGVLAPDTKGSALIVADAPRGPVPSSRLSCPCLPAPTPTRRRRGERPALKRSACDGDPPHQHTQRLESSAPATAVLGPQSRLMMPHEAVPA